jgi:hypothetical protein
MSFAKPKSLKCLMWTDSAELGSFAYLRISHGLCRFSVPLSRTGHIGRDMQRLDLVQCAEPVTVAPGEEPAGRVQIRCPRVPVADGHGEEFQEPTRGMLAGVGDDRRYDHGSRDRGDGARWLGDGHLAAWVRFSPGHGVRVT